MQPFRDIRAWQRAYQLSLSVYKVTESFPPEEKFGLTSQLRRASVSIFSNVAEGSKRKSKADNAHFVNMAEGSSAEIQGLLSLAKDLGYADTEAVEPLIVEADKISGMLYILRASLEKEAERASRK